MSWSGPPPSPSESSTPQSQSERSPSSDLTALAPDQQTELRHDEVLDLAHEALASAKAGIERAEAKLRAADRRYNERMGQPL